MFAIKTDIGVVGDVGVTTTNNKGHDPDFWAARATEKIVSVGTQSHPAIRDQAEAFQQSVFNVISFYMKEAIKSDRTTLAATFEKNQQGEMANIIRRL